MSIQYVWHHQIREKWCVPVSVSIVRATASNQVSSGVSVDGVVDIAVVDPKIFVLDLSVDCECQTDVEGICEHGLPSWCHEQVHVGRLSGFFRSSSWHIFINV